MVAAEGRRRRRQCLFSALPFVGANQLAERQSSAQRSRRQDGACLLLSHGLHAQAKGSLLQTSDAEPIAL